MKRREFLGLLGGAALTAPRMAAAQTQGRIFHLGTMTPVAPMAEGSPFGKIVVKALAQRGYSIGQNLTWDARGSMGDLAKIPAMLDELKSRGVDAIIVIGYPTALAAKPTGIPIIGAIGLGDPVETRLIDSLAHPGGNITGISDVATTLSTKRLQLLKEMSPKLQKVAMLWNKDLIARGEHYLNMASQGDQLTKYHVEAAIAYWHTHQEDTAEKWESILQLYNKLLQLEYSPMAALNRTYALAKANGKAEAIIEAEKLKLSDNHLYHSLLGNLYTNVDDTKALLHFNKALKLARSQADKSAITKNIQALTLPEK